MIYSNIGTEAVTTAIAPLSEVIVALCGVLTVQYIIKYHCHMFRFIHPYNSGLAERTA